MVLEELALKPPERAGRADVILRLCRPVEILKFPMQCVAHPAQGWLVGCGYRQDVGGCRGERVHEGELGFARDWHVQ
jgi:hypothetical protein